MIIQLGIIGAIIAFFYFFAKKSNTFLGVRSNYDKQFYVGFKTRFAEFNLDEIIANVSKSVNKTTPFVSFYLASTNFGEAEVIASIGEKSCHYHHSDSRATVLKGNYYFKLQSSDNIIILKPGDEILIEAEVPHQEGIYCQNEQCRNEAAVILVNWNPLFPIGSNKTTFLDPSACNSNIFPKQPKFESCTNKTVPKLPSNWSATALVHPYSEDVNDSIFRQLNIVNLKYSSSEFLMNIQGCDTGENRIYKLLPNLPPNLNTQVSYDHGKTWTNTFLNWSFPDLEWIKGTYDCVGTTELNWISNKKYDWWKMKAGISSTWIWYDSQTKFPFRLMFGSPPLNIDPTIGDFEQLAFFQMFSFSYIVNFRYGQNVAGYESIFKDIPTISGFSCGNTDNAPLFVWNNYFGATAMDVPVDYDSNPLPTSVFYNYASTSAVGIDRLQVTDLWYDYNPTSSLSHNLILLFGNLSDPSYSSYSDESISLSYYRNGSVDCDRILIDISPGQKSTVPIEVPDWAYKGGGVIHGTISLNGEYCPITDSNITTHLTSVLFPPHLPQYPNSTYLWTLQASIDGNSSRARPITFMQSASTIDVGTSLALADYRDYYEYDSKINFIQKFITNLSDIAYTQNWKKHYLQITFSISTDKLSS